MKGQKVLLIVNPCAGRNNRRASVLDIINKLSVAEYEFTTRTTRCQGDATTIVKECGEEYDCVICCGGDGTVNETINGIMKLDKKPLLGYIPCGSTNDFANTLGIPVGVGPATDLILSDKRNYYDIGCMNGRYFSYIASFGVATDLSYSTPQYLKNLFGHAAYMINGFVIRFIPMLLNFKPTHMKVEFDDGVIEDDFYFGSVSNSNSVGGLFKFDNQNVKLNDGLFELFLVRGLQKNADMIKCLKHAIKQEYDGKQMIIVKTKKVKITCKDSVPWTLDGEFGGNHGNVEIENITNTLQIFSDNKRMFD